MSCLLAMTSSSASGCDASSPQGAETSAQHTGGILTRQLSASGEIRLITGAIGAGAETDAATSALAIASADAVVARGTKRKSSQPLSEETTGFMTLEEVIALRKKPSIIIRPPEGAIPPKGIPPPLSHEEFMRNEAYDRAYGYGYYDAENYIPFDDDTKEWPEYFKTAYERGYTDSIDDRNFEYRRRYSM